VDCPDLPLALAALGFSQLRFEIPIEGRALQLRPVATLGDRLQTEVDPDVGIAAQRFDLDLADDVAIPAAPCVLREVAGFDLALQGTVLPKPEFLAPKEDSGAADRAPTSLQKFHTVLTAFPSVTRRFPLVASFMRKLNALYVFVWSSVAIACTT
jgi:hypothetical protein